MTPDEEAKFWDSYNRHMDPRFKGVYRKGQALFNALFVAAPILADMIRGTDTDPFYRDDRIPAFCKQLGIVEP